MSSPASAPEALPLTVRFDDAVPVLVLPEGLAFEALRAHVRERLPEHLEAIAGRASRLDVGDREIGLLDLRRLIHLLKEEFGVDVTGLYARPEAIQRFAERELKLKLFPTALVVEPEPEPEPAGPIEVEEAELVAPAPEEEVADEEPAAAAVPETPGRRTLYVRRTLRSGSSVRFDGDIVVLGDVNPGADLVASGNVLVLGALKGLAHAGATGDEEAFVWAFDLRPTQIRIARKIAIPPERASDTRIDPFVARIADDRIVIEPYQARTPR